MHEVFRVFPWREAAVQGTPGHAMFVPRKDQGRNRVDNPDLYGVLYLGGDAAGAFAERFSRRSVWNARMFSRPDSDGFAVAAFEIAENRILDLDDPRSLIRRRLRPSAVVTPEREVTQGWARAVFSEKRWAGVRWWSRLDSRWSAAGIWDLRALKLKHKPELLHISHPAVQRAADMLGRVLET